MRTSLRSIDRVGCNDQTLTDARGHPVAPTGTKDYMGKFFSDGLYEVAYTRMYISRYLQHDLVQCLEQADYALHKLQACKREEVYAPADRIDFLRLTWDPVPSEMFPARVAELSLMFLASKRSLGNASQWSTQMKSITRAVQYVHFIYTCQVPSADCSLREAGSRLPGWSAARQAIQQIVFDRKAERRRRSPS